ncbi:MAG: hypothetical protein KJ645_04040, partial [Planctomycetes bacterium]|nr:hypothetical protein [Planctomycetota bacterium]
YIACYNDTNDTLYADFSTDDGVTWGNGGAVFTMSQEPDHPVDPEIEASVNLANVMLCCTKYDVKSDSDNIGWTYSEDFGLHWTSLFSVPGCTDEDDYAPALVANEGGKSWHLAYRQGEAVVYTRSPQDRSDTWYSPNDRVDDAGSLSADDSKIAVAGHWKYDLCGVAWTDTRNGGSWMGDLYYDFTGNVDEIRVPDHRPTIQGGINAVYRNSTVWVEPGNYFETVDFEGRRITVTSTQGPHYTAINADGAGTAVTFADDENKQTSLNGFTIMGGNDEYGGGIFCYKSEPLIRNCVIRGNEAYRGAGVYCDEADPVILHCLFCNNVAEDLGGAVLCTWDAKPYILNSILWNNEASSGPNIHIISGAPEVYFNDIEGGYWGPGIGNINVDPQFVDTSWSDYHLSYNSPCRDAGYNIGNIYYPETDYEGDPRDFNGAPDIGPDEFYPHLYYTGKTSPLMQVVGKVVGMPGTDPIILFFGSGILETPINTIYGSWFLELPFVYIDKLGPVPAGGIIPLPATIPVGAPPEIFMQAFIGNMLSNACVMKIGF